jgi:putative tricarboxylic transport membrane protein
VRTALAIFAMIIAMISGANASPRIDHLSIIVPSSPNGGFDRTAMAVKRALQNEGLVRRVDLIRSPGAGGLVALAQFAGRPSNDANSLIIGGQTILGAVQHNRSLVSLRDVVPIARLNAIAVVIAVRADSPLRNWQDIANAWQNDANAVEWVGGSEGGVDTQLLAILAKKLDIPRARISYSAVPGGGDAVVEKVLTGSHLAAISSFEELSAYLADGRVRAIAVSTANPVTELDAATLAAQGIDVTFTDWKGVFAARGTSAKQQMRLIALFSALAKSASWRNELKNHRWDDNFLAGGAFADFVEAEDAKLAQRTEVSDITNDVVSQFAPAMAREFRYAIWAGLIALALFAALWFRRIINRRKATPLQHLNEPALDTRDMVPSSTTTRPVEVSDYIYSEFVRWDLTEAEKEIAWLIIKGFSFFKIADLRSRSERTIRQQAAAIYAKAGLRSRAELSAYFLEDLFASSSATC